MVCHVDPGVVEVAYRDVLNVDTVESPVGNSASVRWSGASLVILAGNGWPGLETASFFYASFFHFFRVPDRL
jgi:hypothetical protein